MGRNFPPTPPHKKTRSPPRPNTKGGRVVLLKARILAAVYKLGKGKGHKKLPVSADAVEEHLLARADLHPHRYPRYQKAALTQTSHKLESEELVKVSSSGWSASKAARRGIEAKLQGEVSSDSDQEEAASDLIEEGSVSQELYNRMARQVTRHTTKRVTSSPAPIPTRPDRDSSPSSSAPAGVPKIDYSKMSQSELVGRIGPLVDTNLELRGMYEDLKAKYGDLREQNLALLKGVVALRKKSHKQRRRLKKFEALEAASMGRDSAVGGEGEVGDEGAEEELGGARRLASAGFIGMHAPGVGQLDDATAMEVEDDTSASASIVAGAHSLPFAEAEAQRFPAHATPPRTPTPPSQACGSIDPFDDPPCDAANDLAFDIEQADGRMPRPLGATASPDGFAHEESLAISGWEGAYGVEQEEPMEAEQEDTRHQAALSDHPESRKSLRHEDSMLSLSDIIDCSTFESPSPSDELGDELRGQESGVGAQVKSSSSGAEEESEELKLKLHEAELTSRLSKEELDVVSRRHQDELESLVLLHTQESLEKSELEQSVASLESDLKEERKTAEEEHSRAALLEYELILAKSTLAGALPSADQKDKINQLRTTATTSTSRVATLEAQLAVSAEQVAGLQVRISGLEATVKELERRDSLPRPDVNAEKLRLASQFEEKIRECTSLGRELQALDTRDDSDDAAAG